MNININRTLDDLRCDILNCNNILKKTILENLYKIKLEQERIKSTNNTKKEKKNKKYKIKKIKKKKEFEFDDDTKKAYNDLINENDDDEISIDINDNNNNYDLNNKMMDRFNSQIDFINDNSINKSKNRKIIKPYD